MGKIKAPSGFTLDTADNTGGISLPEGFSLDQNVKKKGGTSLNPLPYESSAAPSVSNSSSQVESTTQPNNYDVVNPYKFTPNVNKEATAEERLAAFQNYENKKVTKRDLDILAGTDFGKENGFNNFTTEQKKFFAEAHNAPTQKSNIDAVKTIVNDYAPKLPDSDELIQGVQSGDPVSVNKFKGLITSDLDNQINAIKSNPQGDTENQLVPGAFGARATTRKLSADQARQLKELEGKKAVSGNQLDEYVADALVDKSLKIPEDYFKKVDANRFIEIGRQQRKYKEGDTEYFKTIAATSGVDPKSKNAKTFQNYTDEAAGLQTYIGWKEKRLAQLTQDAIQKKDQSLAEQAGAEANDIQGLYDQLNTLALKKYPAVAYNQWARVIGDKIASKKGFNAFVSQKDVKQASDELVQENPALAEVAERYTQPIAKGESGFGDVPLQGFTGGVSRSFREGAEASSNFVKNILGSRSSKDRKADEIINQFDAERQGTSFSGLSPSKVVLDKNGVAFKELPNENYGSYDWNNLLGMAGNSVGQIVQQGLLTEGLGLAGGIIAKPIVGGINKVGGGVNTLTRTLLGEAKPVFDAAVDGVKFGKEAQLWTGLIGSTYMQAFDQNLGLAEKMVNGNTPIDSFKKHLAANMMTMASAATERILPDNELIKANFFKQIGKDALNILEEVGEKGLTREALDKWVTGSVKPRLMSFVTKAGQNVENSVKDGVEEILDNKFQNLSMALFDENNLKRNDTADDAQAFTAAALGTLALGLPAQVRSAFTPTGKEALWQVGLNPDEYISKINDAVENGSLTQIQADGMIKIANTIGREVDNVRNKTTADGLPLTLPQKKAEAIANFRASTASELKYDNAESIKGEADEISKINSQTPAWQPITSETNPVLKEIGVENLTDIDLNKEYEVSDNKGQKQKLTGQAIADLITAEPFGQDEEDRISELSNKSLPVSDVDGNELQSGKELTKREQAELAYLQSKKELLANFQSQPNEEAQTVATTNDTQSEETGSEGEQIAPENAENKVPEAEVKPVYRKTNDTTYEDQQGAKRFIVPSGNRDIGLVEVDEETYNKWKEIDDADKASIARIRKSTAMSDESKSASIRGIGERSAQNKRQLLGAYSTGEQKRIESNRKKVQIGDTGELQGITYEVVDPSVYGKVKLKVSDGSSLTVEKNNPIVQAILEGKKGRETPKNYIGSVPAGGTVEDYLGTVKGRVRVPAAQAKKANKAAVEEKKNVPKVKPKIRVVYNSETGNYEEKKISEINETPQQENLNNDFEAKFGIPSDELIKMLEDQGVITRIC